MAFRGNACKDPGRVTDRANDTAPVLHTYQMKCDACTRWDWICWLVVTPPFTTHPASTMKIYGLIIYANPPGANAVPLSTSWKLDDFGWLQRGTVQDVMGFMAKVGPASHWQALFAN